MWANIIHVVHGIAERNSSQYVYEINDHLGLPFVLNWIKDINALMLQRFYELIAPLELY